jgi:hypothetical protein
MLRRTRKQISYAIGAVVLVTALAITATLINYTVTTPPQVTPTPAPSFAPINLEGVTAITDPGQNGADTTVDLVATLRNPNPGAGVPAMDVTFNLADSSGQTISNQTQTTYLLPGAVQYVMAFNIPLQHRSLGQINATFNAQPTFVSVPPSVNLPQFNAFAKDLINKTVGNSVVQEQHGLVKNTSTFDWKEVQVSVVALDSANHIVAIGQTALGALNVGEQREFIVTWPTPSAPIDHLVILPSTNMFQADSVIQIIGNPGLLR